MVLKRIIAVFSAVAIAAFAFVGCSDAENNKKQLSVKVLILPKFEVDEISGDYPGEAQYYYEKQL